MTTAQDEQAERRAILSAEHKAATMHGRTDAEVNSIRGRFSATERSMIVGTEPTPTYNTAAPNWSHDPSGPTPPLGIDVNYVEPVGTFEEVQASIDALNDGPALNQQGSAPSCSGAQGEDSLPRPSSPSTPPRKRRI